MIKLFCYKNAIFIALIVHNTYGMFITNKVSLDEMPKDILFMFGKQLLQCCVKNDQIDTQLKEWVTHYSPIKYFTYLNLIINYSKKYPFDCFMYSNGDKCKVKREMGCLFLQIKLSRQSDFFECIDLIKKTDIQNKILFGDTLSVKKYELIRPLLNNEFNNGRREPVYIKRSLSKKVLYCGVTFIGFQFVALLFYLPVLAYSYILTSITIYFFGFPMVYFLGDGFIQKYFLIIIHIGPAIYYLVELCELMKKDYTEGDYGGFY